MSIATDHQGSRDDRPAMADDVARTERTWRRRSLWALLIVLPLTVAESTYEQVWLLLGNRDLLVKDVPLGTEIRFGGGDWRLVELGAATGGFDTRRLPANAVPIVAGFRVKVQEANLRDLWRWCKISLEDTAGKRWSSTVVPGLRLPRDDADDCSAASYSDPQVGTILKVRETFLVPKEAVRTVRPTVGMASERPYYLRFLTKRS